jgi:tetratricopeptide (TPR) repeat protein
MRLIIVLLALVTTLAWAQDAAEKTAADTASSGKTSSEKTASEKAASEKIAAEKTASGKAAADKASADKDSTDKTSSDKVPSDKSSTNKVTAQSPEGEESSSRDTRIDIRPPKDDDKQHPYSKDAVSGLDLADMSDGKVTGQPDTSGIQEFHPWSPMKAMKDVEVGDFYFKHKNYKAALDRYKEALYYKDNDAVASFRLAVCEEKLGDKDEAKKFYEQYLKILPEGPWAKDAQVALERLEKGQ